MKFQAAYSYLKNGRDITLPEWGGFWRWNAETQSIDMHTRKGEVIDIRKSTNMDYTLSFTFRDDWQLVARGAKTEHDQAKTTSEDPRKPTREELEALLRKAKPEPVESPPFSLPNAIGVPQCPYCYHRHYPYQPCVTYVMC